jgi:hypothetical protein
MFLEIPYVDYITISQGYLNLAGDMRITGRTLITFSPSIYLIYINYSGRSTEKA